MVCKFVVAFYRRFILPVFVSGNNGNIIYWSAIFSFWSYIAWYFARLYRMKDPEPEYVYVPDYMHEDAAITSPIWTVWVLYTVAMVSSEVISNLLSIKNNKIEAIRQLTMFVLYALYVGLSTAMVILFYPKYIPASVSFMAPKFLGFLFFLAFNLATTFTASMTNFTYIHYILHETKEIEQLRQRNYTVMASFSYSLCILSFLIFPIFLHWITSPCFVDVCPLCVFAVWALNTFDQYNRNNISSLFGKDIRWRFAIVKPLFIMLLLSLLRSFVYGFKLFPQLDSTDSCCEFAALRPKGYEPVFCWIAFISVVRKDAVQLRINDEYANLEISNADNVNLPSTLKRMNVQTKILASLSPIPYIFAMIVMYGTRAKCLNRL